MARQCRYDSMEQAVEAGRAVGRAIARDVIAEDMPREWTGLDAQDGDQLTSAGIDPGTTAYAVSDAHDIRTYVHPLGGVVDMDLAEARMLECAGLGR